MFIGADLVSLTASNVFIYNTISLFSIEHITMFIAYTLTYINVVKTTTIFLRSIKHFF